MNLGPGFSLRVKVAVITLSDTRRTHSYAFHSIPVRKILFCIAHSDPLTIFNIGTFSVVIQLYYRLFNNISFRFIDVLFIIQKSNGNSRVGVLKNSGKYLIKGIVK